jgi:DNA-binding Lrp family transcriptional regulator
MISKKDYQILSELRNNSRESLTRLSRKTSIPVSTIFDKLKQYEGNLITQHTTLINFSQLGFNTRANIMIKVDRDARESIKEYLSKHQNVNAVYKINNGFDFMFEGIFPNIKDMEDFLEMLDQKFKLDNREVYYIIEDIKRESFMSNPNVLDILIQHAI